MNLSTAKRTVVVMTSIPPLTRLLLVYGKELQTVSDIIRHHVNLLCAIPSSLSRAADAVAGEKGRLVRAVRAAAILARGDDALIELARDLRRLNRASAERDALLRDLHAHPA